MCIRDRISSTHFFELGLQSASINKRFSCFASLIPIVKANFLPSLVLIFSSKLHTTKLSNLFGVGAFAMGIGTALLGRKAAYVCTEAVEEVIEAHYQKQIDELDGIHDDVREKIIKFQEDEVDHKNTAINEGSQQTLGYSILRKTINETTKLAIFMAERY